MSFLPMCGHEAGFLFPFYHIQIADRPITLSYMFNKDVGNLLVTRIGERIGKGCEGKECTRRRGESSEPGKSESN